MAYRLNMPPAEAARYNRATVLVVPVNRETPSRYNRLFPDSAPSGCWLWSKSTSGEGNEQQDLLWLPYPFRPGDVLEIAEDFALDPYHEFPDGRVGDCVWYRADGYDGDGPWAVPPWQAASELPEKFIRHRPTIVSVAAKMLGQLTEKDAERCGCVGVSQWITVAAGVSVNDITVLPSEQFRDDWTADHGSWEPEKWAWVVEIRKDFEQ